MTISETPRENRSAGKRFLAFLRDKGYLLLCMIIPAVLMYLIYLARQVHPFGDGCVLVLDLNGQYVWFFEALRNFVHGDGSLLYSFERALGGEFLGIYAYYLASPLSYLVCLFPKERMLEALLTLFLLKTAICGGTFGYYMHKTAKVKSRTAILIFAIFYALSSYGIVQQNNTMWIDAMMWLPLITLGIEELIRHGKFKLYTFFLAVTLFSNFYIGYMVCFWCAFYFILYYIGHSGKEKENNPLGERVHFLKSLLRMALYSLLAVGIASIILLGAYYSLNFGKSTFSNTKWEWALNFDIEELLYKFLPSSYDTVRPAGYPFVYCGVLTLLLLPAYFFSGKYSMRRKICSAVLVLIFIASFSLSVIDLFWHGFQRPNWLNYRYSFMLCFYLCVLACRALQEMERLPLRIPVGMGGLIALFCVILQKYSDGAYVDPSDYTCIWFTLIAVFLYLAILGVWKSAGKKQIVCVVLVFIVSLEAFLNGLWNMNAFDDDVTFSKYSYYNNFLSKTRPIVEKVQESDTSFYRMEKSFYRKINDNMGLAVHGLSGSTSTLNQETILFLQKMGYASKSHWSKYLGGTPVNDSLLGLKYIISDDSIYQNYYEVYQTDAINGYTAYRNPYALSIAYGVSDDLLEFPLGYSSETTKEREEERNKYKIGSAIEKLKAAINKALDIDETDRNGEYTDLYDSPFTRLNAIITAMLGEEETVQVFVPIKETSYKTSGLQSPWYAEGHTCYDKIESAANPMVSYTLEMPVDGELFFYQPTRFPREVKLTLRNQTSFSSKNYGSFGGDDSMKIVSLGIQHEGDELLLQEKLTGEHLYYVTGATCFYYIDWAVFEDVMARLGQDQLKITNFSEEYFEGLFTASRDDELVMTTIAFDKGWKITVDGEQVETLKALGSVVAFRVPGKAGSTHTVKMIYRPNTFVIGCWTSGISIVVFLLLILLVPILKKIPILRSLVTVPERGKRKKEERREKPKRTKKVTTITLSSDPLPKPETVPEENSGPEQTSEADALGSTLTEPPGSEANPPEKE